MGLKEAGDNLHFSAFLIAMTRPFFSDLGEDPLDDHHVEPAGRHPGYQGWGLFEHVHNNIVISAIPALFGFHQYSIQNCFPVIYRHLLFFL